MIKASRHCDCAWFWRFFKIPLKVSAIYSLSQVLFVVRISPCKAVWINVGTPSGRQRLKVLVVNDESHPARPGGHAVRHLVPRPQHRGRFYHDVVRLEGGVREVEALHLKNLNWRKREKKVRSKPSPLKIKIEKRKIEVKALLHLAPGLILWQLLAAVRHQTCVKYQRIFVLKDLVRKT